MAKEIIMYESTNGKIYKTVHEAEEANYTYKVEQVANSIEGWLESDYPSTNGILLEIMVETKKQFGKLTKVELTKLIDTLKLLVEKEEEG